MQYAYYGESESELKNRAGDHVSTPALTGKSVYSYKKYAVRDHCLFSGHVCSFDGVAVLNYEHTSLNVWYKSHYQV